MKFYGIPFLPFFHRFPISLFLVIMPLDFSGENVFSRTSVCSGRVFAPHVGTWKTFPFRVIPEHARLLTSGLYRNYYFYRTDRGVSVYDARNKWLCDRNGNLLLFDKNGNPAGCRAPGSSTLSGHSYYTSDEDDENRNSNPYVPLLTQKISQEVAPKAKTVPKLEITIKKNIKTEKPTTPIEDKSKLKKIQITRRKYRILTFDFCHKVPYNP